MWFKKKLNKEQNYEVSDTTMLPWKTEAGNKKKINQSNAETITISLTHNL